METCDGRSACRANRKGKQRLITSFLLLIGLVCYPITSRYARRTSIDAQHRFREVMEKEISTSLRVPLVPRVSYDTVHLTG
jgi:hypothetical protein